MEGPRACRPEELDGLRNLENTVFRSNGESCMFREFPTLFHESNCERLRVFVDRGQPVSAIAYVSRPAIIQGNTLRIGSLGAVATLEEYRGRGLATALLEDTFAQMRRENVDVVLISGQRGLYQRAGCAIAGHEMRFSLDGSALARAPERGLVVEEAADVDISDLIALHQNEPSRFVRSPWEWQQFLSVYRLTPKGAEPPFGVRRLWVVHQHDTAVAYFVLSVGRDTTNPTAYVQEFAGDRAAVLSGLTLLKERFGLRTVNGSYLPSDREMNGLLTGLGGSVQASSIGGHRMSFLNPDILRRYDPWVTERLGMEFVGELNLVQSDDVWYLTSGAKRTVAGSLETTNALLWGDAVGDLKGDDADTGVWKRLLPLPFLLPGMNYI